MAVAAALAVASLAIGAAQGYMSYQEEAAFAKAQEEALEESNDLKHDELIRQYQELSSSESKAMFDAHSKSIEAQKQHLVSRSQLEAQAAASGTYGQSLDILFEDLNTTQGVRMRNILDEEQTRLDDANTYAKNAAANYKAGISRTPISQPSAFKHALGGAQTAVSVYSAGSSLASSYGQVAPAKSATSGANITPSYHWRPV